MYGLAPNGLGEHAVVTDRGGPDPAQTPRAAQIYQALRGHRHCEAGPPSDVAFSSEDPHGK